jgi:hypothetical protein
MKIWRTLIRAGAVPFKGSAYILPFNDDHYELLQWLVSGVTGMHGEAAFVRVDSIETLKDAEIISLFDRQREKDYQELGARVDGLENRIDGTATGAATKGIKKLEEELQRITKEFNDLGKIDFFASSARKELGKRLAAASAAISDRTSTEGGTGETEVVTRQVADYQGKTWVTRKRPFIDRIASAWLIRRFIDAKAVFGFINEGDIGSQPADTIVYDMVGGEFTHVGDRCTFEVILEAFGLKSKPLGIVAEIIHQLDVQDDKYRNPAAEGLREILDGIRKTVKDDHEVLTKGMSIFDMFYAAQG